MSSECEASEIFVGGSLFCFDWAGILESLIGLSGGLRYLKTALEDVPSLRALMWALRLMEFRLKNFKFKTPFDKVSWPHIGCTNCDIAACSQQESRWRTSSTSFQNISRHEFLPWFRSFILMSFQTVLPIGHFRILLINQLLDVCNLSTSMPCQKQRDRFRCGRFSQTVRGTVCEINVWHNC